MIYSLIKEAMILYKYLKPCRIDVLENKRIAFPRIFDMNDPFEGQIAVMPDASEMEEALRDDFRVEQAALKVHLENRYSQFGALCLCENADNILLWTHYADNHRGFVIDFNTENTFFNTTEIEIDRLYSDVHIERKGFGSVRKIGYEPK